jgi:hypothetical protein
MMIQIYGGVSNTSFERTAFRHSHGIAHSSVLAGSRQETPKPGTGSTARVLQLEGPMRGGFTC